jgi:hypothetical protein
MWLELAICFGATVIRVPFAMFFFIGYAMSGVLFSGELSAQSRWGAIYGAGALWQQIPMGVVARQSRNGSWAHCRRSDSGRPLTLSSHCIA